MSQRISKTEQRSETKGNGSALRAIPQFDAGALRQLEKPLADHKRVVFAAMARSNLYQALQEAYMDLGAGTMALIILDIDPAKPIHCEAIPAADLLLNRGLSRLRSTPLIPHQTLESVKEDARWTTRQGA